MSFINYAAQGKIKMANEQKDKSVKPTIDNKTDDNIISLDSILDQPKQTIQIEYTLNPRVATINGVPRSVELEIVELGNLMLKYEKFMEENTENLNMGL